MQIWRRRMVLQHNLFISKLSPQGLNSGKAVKDKKLGNVSKWKVCPSLRTEKLWGANYPQVSRITLVGNRIIQKQNWVIRNASFLD